MIRSIADLQTMKVEYEEKMGQSSHLLWHRLYVLRL